MELSYQRNGQSDAKHPPIVLLHGLFGSKENLGTVARALRDDFDVISIDLPNHGRSPHNEHFSYDTMVAGVLALLNQLEVEKFAILGHSMGGKVAMQLALTHPERVTKLMVADIAPVAYEPKHDNVLQGLNSVSLEALQSRKDADAQLAQFIPEPGVRSFLLKSLAKTDNGFDWRFNLDLISQQYHNIRVGFDSQPSYQGPALFIKGGNSDYINASHRDTIMQLFPNSKAHIVNDAGHWLHAEKPDVFNRIVLRFLLA